jgi:hypothetical protein
MGNQAINEDPEKLHEAWVDIGPNASCIDLGDLSVTVSRSLSPQETIVWVVHYESPQKLRIVGESPDVATAKRDSVLAVGSLRQLSELLRESRVERSLLD